MQTQVKLNTSLKVSIIIWSAGLALVAAVAMIGASSLHKSGVRKFKVKDSTQRVATTQALSENGELELAIVNFIAPLDQTVIIKSFNGLLMSSATKEGKDLLSVVKSVSLYERTSVGDVILATEGVHSAAGANKVNVKFNLDQNIGLEKDFLATIVVKAKINKGFTVKTNPYLRFVFPTSYRDYNVVSEAWGKKLKRNQIKVKVHNFWVQVLASPTLEIFQLNDEQGLTTTLKKGEPVTIGIRHSSVPRVKLYLMSTDEQHQVLLKNNVDLNVLGGKKNDKYINFIVPSKAGVSDLPSNLTYKLVVVAADKFLSGAVGYKNVLTQGVDYTEFSGVSLVDRQVSVSVKKGKELEKGEQAVLTFTVTNSGDDSLRIDKAKFGINFSPLNTEWSHTALYALNEDGSLGKKVGKIDTKLPGGDVDIDLVSFGKEKIEAGKSTTYRLKMDHAGKIAQGETLRVELYQLETNQGAIVASGIVTNR